MTRIRFLLFGIILVLLVGSAWAGTIDINSADEASLQMLTGIGATKAAAIVAYRKKHGRYASINDLTQVKGIGPGTLKKISSDISVGKGNAKTTKKSASEATTSSKKSVTAKKPATKKTLDTTKKPESKKQ